MSTTLRPPLLLMPLALVACVGTREQDSRPAIGRNRLVEQARDGQHVLPRGQVSHVDPRSDLVLRFATPAPAEPAQLHKAYLTAKELAGQQSAIVARFAALPPGEGPELNAAQAECKAYSTKVAELFVDVIDLGISQEELMRDAPDFASLVTLLERRTDLAQREVARRRANAEWQVTVRARLERAGSEPRYLHVPWYDTLSEGDMKPRYGGLLGLDQREADTLAAQLRAGEAAAAALREIRAELAHGGDLLRTLRAELRQAIQAMLVRLAANPSQALRNLIADLQGLATQDATRDEATRALKIVQGWLQTLEELQTRVAELRTLAETLQTPGATTLSSLLDADGPIAKAAQSLPGLMGKLGEWPEQAATLTLLLASLTKKRPDQVLPDELRVFLAGVDAEAPALTGALTKLFNLTKFSAPTLRDSVVAASAPPPSHAQTLFTSLDAAPEARIRLGATDVAEGERICIEAIAYPKGQAPGQVPGLGEGRLVDSWEAEVERYGFYPHIGGKLIFARADRGTAAAKDWKPNVAAVADMHLRFRDPNLLGEIWNTLDPGLGVHLASLDQGDENVEFGFGVNLSLFGGFLTGGYGQNLALDTHRDYWFFGVDLLQVLSEAQGLLKR